jgi:hypothetical protein
MARVGGSMGAHGELTGEGKEGEGEEGEGAHLGCSWGGARASWGGAARNSSAPVVFTVYLLYVRRN